MMIDPKYLNLFIKATEMGAIGASRFIGKKYNWIINLIGIIIMLYIAIPIFFGALE